MKRFSWNNVWRVTWWELRKGIRSPVFVAMTLLVPVLIVGSGAVGYFAQRASHEQRFSIALAGEGAQDFQAFLEVSLAGSPITLVHPIAGPEDLEAMVRQGSIDGYLVFDAVEWMRGRIYYYTLNARSAKRQALQASLGGLLRYYRLAELGLGPEQIAAATTPVHIEFLSLSGEETSVAAQVAPMIVVMVLIMAALLSGQVLMYGVIREKRNRIVEILLSSISSLELLVGKLVGVGALSIVQVLVWVAAGLVTAARFVNLADLGLTVSDLAPAIVYFFLGNIMLASLYAAMGASMKDAEGASHAQGMVILIPIIPLFAASFIIMSPNAPWARVLSHVPPFVPVTVLLRLSATDLPAWEYASTLAMLVLSVIVFVYMGARIFERGLLQYDRAMGLGDLRAAFSRYRPGRTRV
ncbi:MAG: ABC transporter permease [Bacillota bacterium]